MIDTLLVNDTLNANPSIAEAPARVPNGRAEVPRHRAVCQVTGGPQTYSARSIKEAHRNLHISRVGRHGAPLRRHSRPVQVPKAEQAELLTIVGSTKGDIVMQLQSASADQP